MKTGHIQTKHYFSIKEATTGAKLPVLAGWVNRTRVWPRVRRETYHTACITVVNGSMGRIQIPQDYHMTEKHIGRINICIYKNEEFHIHFSQAWKLKEGNLPPRAFCYELLIAVCLFHSSLLTHSGCFSHIRNQILSSKVDTVANGMNASVISI